MHAPHGMKLVNFLCGSWTSLVLVFLWAPIFVLVVFSFNASELNVLWEGFTTRWYAELARDHRLIDAARNSLIVAGVTTVISVLLGTSGAWLLHRFRFRAAGLWQALLVIPMAIPEVIMGISLLIFFTAVQAPLNAWLDAWLGVADEPRLGLGFVTMIIAHTTFCFPFVLVAVQSRLADVDPHLEEAALDLGATPWQAFFRVIVPFLRPAIVSGALMSLTLSLDELIVTYFVQGPGSATLPLVVFDHIKKGLNPMLNAVSVVFIVATILLVAAGEWARRARR
jgi:spermidine/putrescine transport system permease protein